MTSPTDVTTSKKFKPMTKKLLAHFEKRLQEERKRVLKELGNYTEDVRSDATKRRWRSQLVLLSYGRSGDRRDGARKGVPFRQPGRAIPWHIDEALRRLYRAPETFGRCHNCGEEIAFERLDALPHARYCFACKQREEDGKR